MSRWFDRTQPTLTAPHASDSAEQRTAETYALEAIGKKLGVELLPRKLQLPDGSCVEIDGGTDGPPPMLAEVYAHQGRLKGGQPHELDRSLVDLGHFVL